MPTRREFLASLAAPALQTKRKPNILYITSDQQRSDDLGANGGQVRTPNLDRMAREGALFRHAFVQFPVCLPSRVSMLTGRYPHAHRVGSNSASLPENEIILPDLLRAQGYFLGATGTMEHEVARHFDEHDYTPALRPKPAPELAQMDRVARSAIFTAAEEKHWDFRCLRVSQRMLRSNPQPLFLSINFHQPHGIVAPVERFARRYDPAKIRLPASFDVGAGGRSPGFAKAVNEQRFHDLTRLEVQTVRARTLASCEMLDAFIGELRQTIEEMGIAENTILVYQSDHGDYGGEFGLIDKSPTSLTDALLRVPLILWAPGRISASGPVDALVEEVDVLPTLLELAGLPARPSIQGRSLMPLVRRETERLHEAVFAETNSDFSTRMIRTPEWKLVESRTGPELYDLRKDPGEMRNVAADHAAEVRELGERLRAYGDPHSG